MTYSGNNNGGQRPSGSRGNESTTAVILGLLWQKPLGTLATVCWAIPALAGFGWNFAIAREPISANIAPTCVFWGGCAGWEAAGLFIPGLDAAAQRTKPLTDGMRSQSGYLQPSIGPQFGNPKPTSTPSNRQSQPIVP